MDNVDVLLSSGKGNRFLIGELNKENLCFYNVRGTQSFGESRAVDDTTLGGLIHATYIR